MQIKITRSDLIKVLKDYFPEYGEFIFDDIFDELAESNVKRSQTDSFKFLKLFSYYRRQRLKHKAVKTLKSNIPIVDGFIEEVNKFCEQYQLSKHEGYLAFIEIGVFLMGAKPRLQFFPSKIESIFDTYEDWKSVQEDPNSQVTSHLVDYYRLKVLSFTGLEFTPGLSDLVNFVKASKFCINNNITPEILVDGAFEVLSWKQGVPSTGALASPKIHNQLGNYISTNHIEVKNDSLILKLKNLKTLRND